jgi:hypothetical protein
MRIQHPKQLDLWHPEGVNGSVYEGTSSQTKDSQYPGYREAMIFVLVLRLWKILLVLGCVIHGKCRPIHQEYPSIAP